MALTTSPPVPASSTSDPKYSQSNNLAVSTAIDAHASRILRLTSPSSSSIDASLGPYVTSILRCACVNNPNIVHLDNIPEFEGLMELLMEHCCISLDEAKVALEKIYTSVRTGKVNDMHGQWSMNTVHSVPDDMDFKWEQMLPPRTNADFNYQSFFGSPQKVNSHQCSLMPIVYPTPNSPYPNIPESPGLKSPDKARSFLPPDLLAIMDGPPTPLIKLHPAPRHSDAIPNQDASIRKVSLDQESVPMSSPATTPPSSPPLTAKDLAASLFTSRSRSNSSADHNNTVGPNNAKPQLQPTTMTPTQMHYSTASLLLFHNSDLSEDAATVASLTANGDVNLAQYLIDTAKEAPPVCRHMLNNACYRSDCQFSHDVEGHTCTFWLRGRCGRSDSCRFLHGFSDKILEEVGASPGAVGHGYNMTDGREMQPRHGNTYGTAGIYNSSPVMMTPTHTSTPLSALSPTFVFDSNDVAMKRHESDDNKFSFASVASKGYSKSSFSEQNPLPASLNNGQPNVTSTTAPRMTKFAKIPVDLWTIHHKRDSSLFHIADPIERYHEVSSDVMQSRRKNIIDLHFQSLKTFGVVLEAILPAKLQENPEVWIVTGSGHHVSFKSHQKGGGVLENAVIGWLKKEGYVFVKGRDKNGYGGAVLVIRSGNTKI